MRGHRVSPQTVSTLAPTWLPRRWEVRVRMNRFQWRLSNSFFQSDSSRTETKRHVFCPISFARSPWPSHLVGSKKLFARRNESVAAVQTLMTRPHSRNKTDVSWSLHPSDLSLSAPIRLQTWSVGEPALEQLRNDDQWQLGIARESLEFDLNCVGVVSTPLATPRIETVGCIFEVSKSQKSE